MGPRGGRGGANERPGRSESGMPATAEPRMGLEAFFASLDAQDGRPDLGDLRRRLERLEVSFEDIAHVARFSPNGYQRNLLHAGAHWHALILCWDSGQRSPIHDHAQSVCGVRIIRGTATETIFERTDSGQLKAVSSSDLHEGEVCASRDADCPGEACYFNSRTGAALESAFESIALGLNKLRVAK